MSTRTHRFIIHSPRARWVYSYASLREARSEWPDRPVIEQKRTNHGKDWVEWTTIKEHKPDDQKR